MNRLQFRKTELPEPLRKNRKRTGRERGGMLGETLIPHPMVSKSNKHIES